MKKLLYLALFIPALQFAQVIIGTGKTAITNKSVSLEFGTEPKGIALPMATNSASVTGAVPGTLIFDSSDMKVKLKQASSWKDYTIDSTGKADLSIQNKYTELTSAKVSIGKPTATPGILVLEDTDKGMILPLVDSYKAVQSPTAGLIVYDTALKMLCTYNGSVWSFWTGI